MNTVAEAPLVTLNQAHVAKTDVPHPARANAVTASEVLSFRLGSEE